MRIIVGDGKVSRAIRKSTDVILSHDDIEITEQPSSIAKVLAAARARLPADLMRIVVVNTAALINLEWCEEHKARCMATNAYGALNLGRACDMLGFELVHVSSGCIFDGMETGREYTEDDEPTPASFYAEAKAIGDRLLLADGLTVPLLILRPRQLVSAVPNKTNMLTKLLSIGKGVRLIPSQNSVTCLEDFSVMLDHLIDSRSTGIYNVANDSSISPYEVGLRLKKIDPEFNPQLIRYDEYLKTINVKRVNTLLDISKLKATGFVPRTAIEAVDWCVDNYGKVLS